MLEEYTKLQEAYNKFNESIFENTLPKCFITLQRKKQVYGYFHPNRFNTRGVVNGESVAELALNPDNFEARTDKEILSTLLHEMTHVWQHYFGKPGGGGYHNREWARKMLAVGLKPISIDFPGKMTGNKVTHEIMPKGLFEHYCDIILAEGFALNWQSKLSAPVNQVVQSRVKFSCPNCGQNAFAKPGNLLMCGVCRVDMGDSTQG